MLAQESWTNETEGYRVGDSGLYEPWTDNIGKLFRAYQREYGRCVSRIYVDKADSAQAVGWVFEKIARYTDTNEPYLQHTWVTLYDEQPTRTTIYHYHTLH